MRFIKESKRERRPRIAQGGEKARSGREKGDFVKNEKEKWDLSKNGRGEGK